MSSMCGMTLVIGIFSASFIVAWWDMMKPAPEQCGKACEMTHVMKICQVKIIEKNWSLQTLKKICYDF